jgi:hypothetical protein
MANTIALANKFMPILDELYKKASVTAMLDAMTKPVNFAGANEVKVFKISTVGLGDYSRANGYAAGDITGEWETIQLTQERGREFNVDRMDNDESLGMAFGKLASEFIRLHVAPEIDAYRFATWAQTANILGTQAALATADDVLTAIDTAAGELDTNEVPMEGRKLFIESTIYRLLMGAITRSLANESTVDRRIKKLDEMQVIPVPQSRFYDSITTNAGATSDAGGFVKTATTGLDLNFVLMHPTAVDQATKLANLKIFTPDENQSKDAWLFQYRLYHDAWVYDNKVKGVYVHTHTL